jgi:hypothetical protein
MMDRQKKILEGSDSGMATLIPALGSCASRMASSEHRLSQAHPQPLQVGQQLANLHPRFIYSQLGGPTVAHLTAKTALPDFGFQQAA